MKKRLLFISMILFFAGFYSYFYQQGPNIEAKSYILIDAKSGKQIIGKNEDVPFAAASMSKLMTEYLVLKSIEEGILDWYDQVLMSEHAASCIGVKINVPAGAKLTIRDLFNSMVVASANNAAIALAEAVAGSEEKFTVLMNEQAQALGLSDQTYFINASGLPNHENQENMMTARDVSKLGQQLLSHYPEVLEITKLTAYQMAFDGSLVYSTNRMLNENNETLWFEGVDGLKTGFTDRAGYCFTGTVENGDERLISVVMGTEEADSRFVETKKLYAYGLNQTPNLSFKTIVKEYVRR